MHNTVYVCTSIQNVVILNPDKFIKINAAKPVGSGAQTPQRAHCGFALVPTTQLRACPISSDKYGAIKLLSILCVLQTQQDSCVWREQREVFGYTDR